MNEYPEIRMTDHLNTQQRHVNMAAIKGKNTLPEMVVRRYLWAHGFRYRLNHKRLPGKPDIVLRKYRTCILVNGCFWHGHQDCPYFVMPKTRQDFWNAKITRNRARDIEVQHKLAQMGWHCITIWECQLKPACREQTLKSLIYTLNRIFLHDHSVKPYAVPNETDTMVAESISNYKTDVYEKHSILADTVLGHGGTSTD